ncbi:MAG: penicillin acylase family protein [Chitinophagaceae bacterium]|nr:penicillin acylase family protein [Chitinophagaceae bacterium]
MRIVFTTILSIIWMLCKAQVNPANITIVRDSFGVPHIFAPTDPEVSYGLAWAHAEDDFKSLQEVVWPVKGLMGKALGKRGAAGDYAFRLLRCMQITEQRWHELSPAFIKLIEGYVQGVNDYAMAHPDEVILKRTFPVTPKEYIAATVFALSVFNGAEGALVRIFNNRVPDPPAPDGKKGSNAFAIHGNKTTSGEAMLVVNAHQPNTGPQAFYEAHVCSEEGWNALGGLLAGGPCIFHGVNEHLGWAHTVNYVDRFDVYKLTMHPTDPLLYEVDGEWKKLEVEKVKLKIKGIPFSVSRKAYWSIYGATMKNKQGAYSMRMGANMEIAAIEQWYMMNKAKNHTEFYHALSKQALSMFNIVYADKYDTIFYINNALVPYRDSLNGFNWKATLPGNTSKTLWTSFKPLEYLPQYVNPKSGVLFNTNHSSFFASGQEDNLKPEQYAKEDGWETYHNNRSVRVYELLGPEKISFDRLKEIKFDKQLPKQLAYPIQIDTMFLLDTLKHPEISYQINTFRNWDRNAIPDSRGAAVFLLIYRNLERTTPRQLTYQECVEVLKKVKEYQVKYFGREDITLGDLQRLVRGNESFPMYGIPDVLTAEWGEQQHDGTIKVTGGDGYVMFIRFPKEGLPQIESLNM